MLFLTNLQQQIIERIKFGSETISNKDIAKNIVNHWRGSDQIKDMLTAQEYHLVKNTGIDSKSRDYLVPVQREDGTYSEEKRTNETLSNVKLKSALPRLSVEQKVNYGFAKPFVFEVSLEGQEAGAKEPQELITYRNEWNAFLNDDTRDTIKRIYTDSCINGKGWGYPTVDSEMRLQLVDVMPQTFYPEWADRAHKRLDIGVRDYAIIYYRNGIPETIRKVEYWDNETVEFYIDDGGDWKIDTDTEAFILGDTPPPGKGGIPHLLTVGWGRVPFICLKSNPDELPLLNIIKSYIDLMDKLKSKMGDTLMDDMDAILMLKGLSPAMQDLMRSRVNLKNSGIVSVDADKGDAKYIKNDASVDAAIKAIEAYYKDILQYSATVDMQGDSRTIRQTQDALKMMYQPLDIYMNGAESHFREFMGNLKYFFDKSLEFRGIGSVETWDKFSIDVTLNRDMLVSEAEIIDNLIKSASILSQETLISQHPYTIDYETEKARLESEQQSALDNMAMERKFAEAQLQDEKP